MSNYRFTEEYLDRFGLNKGDIYWLEQAIECYKEKDLYQHTVYIQC